MRGPRGGVDLGLQCPVLLVGQCCGSVCCAVGMLRVLIAIALILFWGGVLCCAALAMFHSVSAKQGPAQTLSSVIVSHL